MPETGVSRGGSEGRSSAVRSVLVVDDEKHIRVTLADILAEEGYEVGTADTGDEAVRICQRRSFDVILMDVRMPGMDGFEAFRIIRRRCHDVRVIMMSAYGMNAFRRVARDEGATAFLQKPLDVARLLRLIDGRE
jgi:CheY-like chemotaxis protein